MGSKFLLGLLRSSPVRFCMPKNARYAHLLGDPEIREWHANVAWGSRITADSYRCRFASRIILAISVFSGNPLLEYSL